MVAFVVTNLGKIKGRRIIINDDCTEIGSILGIIVFLMHIAD